MILLELRMRNFRQHADSHIVFGPGLTGVVGPNGAGKSTIMEAIAWAIYGADAARGTNETLRFARSEARARVEVELRFGMAGREYRVVRSLTGAEVYVDGRAAPVAGSLSAATKYLQQVLGLSRREFFNTHFTGQKELQFLASMGAAERARFLSRVLGYERLRHAQDAARRRRTELRHEIDALRSSLGDTAALGAERGEAEARLDAARAALVEAQSRRADAAERLADLAPRWAEAQRTRDRHRELSHALDAADREAELLDREVERLESELRTSRGARERHTELRRGLGALREAKAERDRLTQLARLDERRRALAGQLAGIEAERHRADERFARLERAPSLLTRHAAEVERLEAELDAARAAADEARTAWLRDRQDAETKLLGFRERGQELREQIRKLRELGPAGSCPTCGRPLDEQHPRLLAELEEQWNLIVQDGKWWKSRREQLEAPPATVGERDARHAELRDELAGARRRLARCENAVQELGVLSEGRDAQTAREAELRAEIAALPAGYDAERHAAAETRLHELRERETEAVRLEPLADAVERLEAALGTARGRRDAARERRRRTEEERRALGFSEERHARLHDIHEAAAAELRRAELRAVELDGTRKAAAEGMAAVERAEERQRERLREVELRDDELRHHQELDVALTRFRSELNSRLRPELGEIASLFLAQLTDGRYTALELSEDYEILVLDEGEEKPVISGGEEDVANLVLRLSLSRMIAERAGQPLSLLVLDEVFGSLDVARRDNVVRLLRRLQHRFEQVVVITHLESIREGFDRVLRVEFDERTGASVVRDETLPDSGPPPGLGIAAD